MLRSLPRPVERRFTSTVLAAACLMACVPNSHGSPRATVLGFRVEDGHGGVWSAEESPRLPRVALQVSPPDAALSGRVFWVRGEADPDLLEDLADPPLREATRARLLAHTLEPGPGGARTRPTDPLTAGEQVTLLVWEGGPQTGESGWWQRSLQVSASPAAGARFVASLPPDGAAVVSAATRRALLHWDGHVEGLATAQARLEDASGERDLALESFDCANEGLPHGSCAWVDLDALSPGTAQTLRVRGPLFDATGEALPPPRVTFSLHGEAEPPALRAPPCAPDERAIPAGCARATRDHFVLRTTTRAPALVSLAQGAARVAAIAGPDPVVLRLRVGGPGEATLEARDLTGRIDSTAVQTWLETDLPHVRIHQVLSAPLGSDAHSEYVEVVNRGDETEALDGWTLSKRTDTAGRTATGTALLPPEGRALLVGPEFDPASLRDLPGGAARLVLDGPLSLPDGGGALVLRDARGRRVDALRVPPSAQGRCVSIHDDGRLSQGACRYPEAGAP